MTTKRKILIDTDPGVDDAYAIIWALKNPQLDVVGLTSTFGNVWPEQGAANARCIVELCGHADVPVAVGARNPLQGTFRGPAAYVHGNNGLGDAVLADPVHPPIATGAADFIIEMSHRYAGELTLVPVGPLTNLALALKADPTLPTRIREVVVMGGAFRVSGNIHPAAEANFFNDPLAADHVVTAPWKTTCFGLDVTNQVQITPAMVDDIKKIGTAETDFLGAISPFYMDFYQKVTGLRGFAFHDACTIAYLVNPKLFTYWNGPVRVLTDSQYPGHSILAEHRNWPFPTLWTEVPDVQVARTVDSAGVWQAFLRDL
jgi:inosine-uridine nucleoside N-ribohydrolase